MDSNSGNNVELQMIVADLSRIDNCSVHSVGRVT